MRESTALKALWGTILVQLAGRALDLRWHATHDEFEGASEQITAHWLAWLGIIATLLVSLAAYRILTRAGVGWTITLTSALGYIPIATWHFIEHANLNDPELAHVLLAITQLGMLAGAIITTLLARQRGLATSE